MASAWDSDEERATPARRRIALRLLVELLSVGVSQDAAGLLSVLHTLVCWHSLGVARLLEACIAISRTMNMQTTMWYVLLREAFICQPICMLEGKSDFNNRNVFEQTVGSRCDTALQVAEGEREGPDAHAALALVAAYAKAAREDLLGYAPRPPADLPADLLPEVGPPSHIVPLPPPESGSLVSFSSPHCICAQILLPCIRRSHPSLYPSLCP